MSKGDEFVSQILDSLPAKAIPAGSQVWGPIEECGCTLVSASLSFFQKKKGQRLWIEVPNPRKRNQLEEELSSFPGPQPIVLRVMSMAR